MAAAWAAEGRALAATPAAAWRSEGPGFPSIIEPPADSDRPAAATIATSNASSAVTSCIDC